MAERPYTLLNCSVSIDGYLDDATPRRLILSNEEDLDRVDAIRAESDAILVGAATVRRDNPRLLVRSESRRDARRARGRPRGPVKVTVTEHADLDPCAAFFTLGDVDKLVYCPTGSGAAVRLGGVATVIESGPPVRMRAVSEDLHARGVRRLLVEGGGSTITQFLADELADELNLVVAPFFVGDPGAARFVDARSLPWTPSHPARLVETRRMGEVVLLRYALSERCPG